MTEGKIACQETGGRAQAYGTARREIRVIRRELDCPNPSLQKVQPHARRKDVCNRRRPLWRYDEFHRCNPPGRWSDACQALKETNGTPKSRYERMTLLNVGSPKGREPYGDRVPVLVGGVTSAQSGDRESRTTGRRGTGDGL